MIYNKQHIGYKLAAFLLVLSFVLPVAVKFTHALNHHEHEVCIGINQSHFHEVDLDCEFYKFKINHNLYVSKFNYEVNSNFLIHTSEIAYYTFLKSQRQLTSYLRGPPVTV